MTPNEKIYAPEVPDPHPFNCIEWYIAQGYLNSDYLDSYIGFFRLRYCKN